MVILIYIPNIIFLCIVRQLITLYIDQKGKVIVDGHDDGRGCDRK